MINQQTCPDCGAEMKQRDGKFGPFWGCSNYPNCKKIVKISQNTPSTGEKAQYGANKAINEANFNGDAQPDWDKIRDEKTENINWMNAKNNACLLIANGKYSGGEELVDAIKILALEIYLLEPTKLVEDDNGDLKVNEVPF